MKFCCNLKTQPKKIADEKSNKPETYLAAASENIQSITNKNENTVINSVVVPDAQEITGNSLHHQEKEMEIVKPVLEEKASFSLQKVKDSQLHVRFKRENSRREIQHTRFPQTQILSENTKPQETVSGLNFEEGSNDHSADKNGESNIFEDSNKSADIQSNTTVTEEPNKSYHSRKIDITAGNTDTLNHGHLMNVSHKEQDVKNKQPASLSANNKQKISQYDPYTHTENEAFRNNPDHRDNLHTVRKCDPNDFSCHNGHKKETNTEEPSRSDTLRNTQGIQPNSTKARDNSIDSSMLFSMTSFGESEPLSLQTNPIILGSRYQPIDLSFTNSRDNSLSRAFKSIRDLTKKGLSFTIFYWIYVAAFLYVACYLLGFIIAPFSVLGFIIKIIIVQFFPAIISLHFFHAADIILEYVYNQIP